MANFNSPKMITFPVKEKNLLIHVNLKITASFNDTRTLKFKTQLDIAFFTAANDNYENTEPSDPE